MVKLIFSELGVKMSEVTIPPTTDVPPQPSLDPVPTNTPVPQPPQPLSLNIILTPQQADGHFIHVFNRMTDMVNKNAVEHGFWEGTPNDGEKLALIHSEVSEVLEIIRSGNITEKDSKVPQISALEAELADVIIRVMDFAKQKGCRLGEALLLKHRFNITRPYKHGKKF